MLGCNKGFSGKGSKRSVELRGKKEAENGLNKQLRAIVRKKKHFVTTLKSRLLLENYKKTVKDFQHKVKIYNIHTIQI